VDGIQLAASAAAATIAEIRTRRIPRSLPRRRARRKANGQTMAGCGNAP